MKFFSIVVPLACRSEPQFSFFERLLDSIGRQTFSDYEVVVSDDLPSERSHELCLALGRSSEVRYFEHPYGPGNSSANANYAISKAGGMFIKIMHQDDFFYSGDALQSIRDAIERAPETKWGVVGFNHVAQSEPNQFFREIVPRLEGTLGCPSVSFFYGGGEPLVFFDESLIQINDHDIHQRLLWKFGQPLVVPETLVSIGLHDSQVTHSVSTLRSKLERRFFLDRQRLFLYQFPELETALQRNPRLNATDGNEGLLYVFEDNRGPVFLGRGLHPLGAKPPGFLRLRSLWSNALRRKHSG